MAFPSSTLPRITFRLPEELRDQLEAAARENNRSLNAELVARLEASFEHQTAVEDLHELRKDAEAFGARLEQYKEARQVWADWVVASIREMIDGREAPPLPDLLVDRDTRSE